LIETRETFRCSGCDDKEKGFITKWQDKSAADIAAQADRLEKMSTGSMKKDLMQWVKKRLAILKQMAPQAGEREGSDI
jgi:hypothetical protein